MTENLPELPSGYDWLTLTVAIDRTDPPSVTDVGPVLAEAYSRALSQRSA